MISPSPRVPSLPEACPYCSGHHIVRKGQRKKKLETIQLWRCNDCNKVFTPQPVRGKSFPLPLILQAVTLFNQGYSPDAVCRLMTERSGLPFAPSTLSSWVSEHRGLCAYSRLRDAGRKLFGPQQIIRSVKLYHQQVYEFSVHRAKLQLLIGSPSAPDANFGPVRNFLDVMQRRCPHDLFKTTTRASSAKRSSSFSLDQVSIIEKQNFATRIAHLVLPTTPGNKQRHETLQKFMLSNDSVTVATEVPIYLLPEDIEHLQERLGFEIPLHLDHPDRPHRLPSDQKRRRAHSGL